MYASLSVFFLVTFLAAPSQARAAPDVPVWFGGDGETYTSSSLPAAVDAQSRAALAKWLACLAESEVAYTAEVLAGGAGVYILAPEIVVAKAKEKVIGSTRADRRRKLEAERKRKKEEEAARRANAGPKKPPEVVRREELARTRELFDRLLPKPQPRRNSATLWGRDVQRAQKEVAVLIMVRDRADFHRVLDAVLETNKYLATFIEDVKESKLTGVIIETPLVGVVVQQPEASEEHRPHHELVKRQVELLLFQRFGPLPFFAREGLAWCFEWSELGRLRTFTGRTTFIGVDDPAYLGWPRIRARQFQRGTGLRLTDDTSVMKRLREWRSDKYDDDLAAASFQLAHCLIDRHPRKISEVLAGWASRTAEKRGSKTDAGGWILDPEFVLSAEDLVAGLQGVRLLESVRKYGE